MKNSVFAQRSVTVSQCGNICLPLCRYAQWAIVTANDTNRWKWLWQLVSAILLFRYFVRKSAMSLRCETHTQPWCRCTFNCLRPSNDPHTNTPEVTVTQFKHFTRFINRFLYQNGKNFRRLDGKMRVTIPPMPSAAHFAIPPSSV